VAGFVQKIDWRVQYQKMNLRGIAFQKGTSKKKKKIGSFISRLNTCLKSGEGFVCLAVLFNA
jgi:hypothetical protein